MLVLYIMKMVLSGSSMLEEFSKRSLCLTRKKSMSKKLKREAKVKMYRKEHFPHLTMEKNPTSVKYILL